MLVDFLREIKKVDKFLTKGVAPDGYGNEGTDRKALISSFYSNLKLVMKVRFLLRILKVL